MLPQPQDGTRLARAPVMQSVRHWAARLALSAGLVATIVAACHGEVPGPSGPLPPTREVPPQGPRPGPLAPAPIETVDAAIPVPVPSPGPSSAAFIASHATVAVAEPMQAVDAGVTDAAGDGPADLPPLPDAPVPLDAPAIAK